MRITLVNCYTDFLQDDTKLIKIMTKLVKGEPLSTMSFGKKRKMLRSSKGFFSHEDTYLHLSGIFSCRETLTSMLRSAFAHNPISEAVTVFALIDFDKKEPITKYSNAKIQKFALNFLNTCQSYRWATSTNAVLNKSNVKCFTLKKESKRGLIFPITINDRGKSFTTASALLSLLRFPEFIFTKGKNDRRMGGIVNILKKHFMEVLEGNADNDEEVPHNYYGYPHYSAYFILWLVFAKYGVNIVSSNVSGPINLMQELNERSLTQSILRHNYNSSLTGVLSLGDKFLLKLDPTIYSFIEERKKVLKL